MYFWIYTPGAASYTVNAPTKLRLAGCGAEKAAHAAHAGRGWDVFGRQAMPIPIRHAGPAEAA